MVNPNAMAFTRVGAATKRTLDTHLGMVINVRDFGATGSGSGDDSAAIQAAFNVAFGTAGSPHGNAGRFTNRPVYFPSGSYNILSPLYLTNVQGGYIFGDSMLSSRIAYNGSLSGNTLIANGITPAIMTNGFRYSRMEKLNVAIGGANTAAIYLFETGSTSGSVNQNVFSEILVESALAGFLIGYQADNAYAMCSENTFVGCSAIGCGFGFRSIFSNALNNRLVNCSASSCTTHGVSCPQGAILLDGGSFAGNAIDISAGQEPMVINGSRSESANFVDVSSSSGVVHTMMGCAQAAGAGAGYFLNLGSGSKVIIDASNQQDSLSTAGKIVGPVGSTIYLRGSHFTNTSYLTSFSGTVGQNI